MNSTLNKPQTAEEWFGAIEVLRRLVAPQLNMMKLVKLGEVECIPDMDQGRADHMSINWGRPKVIAGNNVTLETLGLFFPQSSFDAIKYPKMNNGADRYGDIERGLIKVWGLTSFGWVITIVQYQYWNLHFMGSFAGTAEIVNIYETNLATIAYELRINPKWIWWQLAQTIENQYKRASFGSQKEIHDEVAAQIEAFA